jgi:hypothetical protein
MKQINRSIGVILSAMPLVPSFSAAGSAEEFQVFCKPLNKTWENPQIFDIIPEKHEVVQIVASPTGTPTSDRVEYNNKNGQQNVSIDSEYIKLNPEKGDWLWAFDRRTGILKHLYGTIYSCEKGHFVSFTKTIKREDLPQKF